LPTDVLSRTLLNELAQIEKDFLLVLVSRSNPPLPLSKLRARMQLAELRFTYMETAAFMKQELGTAAADESAAALFKRVEGWVAGMRLAILFLHQLGSLELAPAHLRGKADFTSTLRVAGFAQSAHLLEIFGFLPVIGPVVRFLA